jgi:ketosteroid isomerase-like protein
MTRSRSFAHCAAVVAVVLALLALPLALPAQSNAARAAIDAANARATAAFNRGDVPAFAKIYASDATILPPNMSAIHGQPSIADFWQGAYNSGVRNVRLTTTELHVNGSEATEVGTALLDVQSPQGTVVATDHGKYIVYWKRNSKGEWQWDRDIWNSDLPPMQPASAASTNASATSSHARAMPGDTVWVILNAIKPAERAHFEEFVRIFWGAGLGAADPATKHIFATTRVLYPTKADADGNYTYVYLMDPKVSGGNYSEEKLSRALLPAAQAERILALMQGAYARPQQLFLVTEGTRAQLQMP